MNGRGRASDYNHEIYIHEPVFWLDLQNLHKAKILSTMVYDKHLISLFSILNQACFREALPLFSNNNNNNNNTQIAAIALLPLTTHPQLWAELLTFKPKCTIA